MPDAPDHTVDLFHRGGFHLVQPAARGHRAGIDAMILAAAVPSGFAGRVVDFGAGAGAAALAVLSRCPQATAVLVERSAEMAGFACKTLALPENAALAERATVLEADVTLTGQRRIDAGLLDRSADFVIMNPPFNTAHHRPSPDSLKKQAHMMEEGLFESWLRSAGAVVMPTGSVALIARPSSLPAILAALSGRFGDSEILPVHPRSDLAAIRIVLRARRGSRAALRLCPPLILHEGPANRFTQRANDINNGRASLFGD
ncbi:MAG TPA: methyltransferase [Rhizobiaceae bacterium]|nr:methyltransferase [Rhizobiaceae bacterium]